MYFSSPANDVLPHASQGAQREAKTAKRDWCTCINAKKPSPG